MEWGGREQVSKGLNVYVRSGDRKEPQRDVKMWPRGGRNETAKNCRVTEF